MMDEIASFTPVPIRDIWPKEDQDFTPWLAKNIDRLGEALGVEFRGTTVETEVSVGPFKLDVLAEDEEGRRIAIENQFGVTNHSHLGQVLTYAAGIDASVVVWLVEGFQTEHRQALEWLNRHTHEGIEFYAVQLSAVRIESSRPVPVFEVVARPNKPQSNLKQPSEQGDKYLDFWRRVIDELKDKRFTPQNKAPTRNPYIIFWSGRVTGGNGIALGADFTKDGARAHIYLDPFGDRERNHDFFDQLKEEREEEIEQQYENPLRWSKLPNRGCRIWDWRQNASIQDEESSLEETAKWMVGCLTALKDKVIPHVQQAIEVEKQQPETQEV